MLMAVDVPVLQKGSHRRHGQTIVQRFSVFSSEDSALQHHSSVETRQLQSGDKQQGSSFLEHHGALAHATALLRSLPVHGR